MPALCSLQAVPNLHASFPWFVTEEAAEADKHPTCLFAILTPLNTAAIHKIVLERDSKNANRFPEAGGRNGVDLFMRARNHIARKRAVRMLYLILATALRGRGEKWRHSGQ